MAGTLTTRRKKVEPAEATWKAGRRGAALRPSAQHTVSRGPAVGAEAPSVTRTAQEPTPAKLPNVLVAGLVL